MIKAIETRYKGYRFRSRLEARWAVFFDALGIEWQYEPEGFELPDGTRYLPDFWLPWAERFPGGGYWIEIKGGSPTEAEQEKARQLATGGHSAIIISGAPGGHQCIEFGRDGRVSRSESLGSLVFLLRKGESTSLAMIDAAYEAARSARFEHGESGAN